MYRHVHRSFFLAPVVLAVMSGGALAQTDQLSPLAQALCAEVETDVSHLVAIYKDIHANPELAFMETRTAGIVADELEALGYRVETGVGGTGVTGVLENGEGPIVMFRGDMDANAVREQTGLPYASTTVVTRSTPEGGEEQVPVMHACGHDAHTTWLIAVARAFARTRDRWSGTLVVVAQPAEEVIEGARAMVADGLYTSRGVPQPDFLLGLHTAPMPTGIVSCTPGDQLAGTDQLDVTFRGVGGHGSSPHQTKDPVVMACSAVVQYQSIVSRAIDPLHSAVLTVGSIQAGSDNNVIPDSALLKINLRWYDEADRELMLKGIERINRAVAMSSDLPEELYPQTVMKGGSGVLSNDAELANIAEPVLRTLLGADSVITDFPKVMGSEDFPDLLHSNDVQRYLFLSVGTAKPAHVEEALRQGKDVPYANHNPDYQVDLNALPVGAKVGVTTLAAFFERKR